MKTGLHIKLTVQKAKVSCAKKRGVSYDWKDQDKDEERKGEECQAQTLRVYTVDTDNEERFLQK